MLVSEKKSVYLLITKKFASLIIKNLKIKFENFYFQIFTIPLIFEMTNSDRIFKSDSVSAKANSSPIVTIPVTFFENNSSNITLNSSLNSRDVLARPFSGRSS